MAVFENCSVLLELKYLPVKDKERLKSVIIDNGGNISFVVNKQCSLIVTSDVSSLSSNRLRSIQKYQTPVVGLDYVYSCVHRGVLLPLDEYKLDAFSLALISSPKRQVSKVPTSKAFPELLRGHSVSVTQKTDAPERHGNVLEKFRIYSETDSDLPSYPDRFQVAKYLILEKINSNTWCVLELQSSKGNNGQQYRVVRYWANDVEAKKAAVKDMLVFLSTSEEALEVYQALRRTLEATGLQLRDSIPLQAQNLGSAPLQQLLLEEKLNTGSLSQEVGVFVELLWTEALGCLDNVLTVSIDKLSLNDVSRAEGLLLQAQKKMNESNLTEVTSLMAEVYTLLPHRRPQPLLVCNTKLISQKLDLCQLIRDVLHVSEMTLRSPTNSCLGKYRALRCSIETVPPSSPEYEAVTALLQDSKLQIQQVLQVCRGVELQTFRSDLGNIKPLLHSSSPTNFVGIMSRGLLLPRVGVEHHGIERTDVGNLGSGIYFSDAVSTSLKYSKPSVTDGSRLLLVCDVALGRCKDVHKRDVTLTQAPEGHHSVHGIRCTPKTQSEFGDDEYVVYSPDQVKLKYVVQFSIEGDQLSEFSPAIDTSAEPCLASSGPELMSEDDGVEIIKNPLEDVTAGLLDSAGQQLPLQGVHVRCKLMDLLSQVIIFQKYTNMSSVPIEAKYVFPLDDSAAVCGFEAFINGKHVVGQVKEKEKARREYKQAIEKGHGAYLMDQDAPDVFTISVGNLPPGATVLIKVTFVSELIVRDGSIFFSLPGSVAPWQESAALNQTTQVTVKKVCVTDDAENTREFTLDMSIEMPHEITSLHCITHRVKMKRTACKAVVSVLPGEVMGPDGFQLSVTLSDVHLPRMWVEKHPDKDSQACMLVFYPHFDVGSSSASDEVVLLLDTSESMKGESLRMAQRIALQVLKTLDRNLRLNVILFGTDHKEAFLTAQPLVEAREAAERFIRLFAPVGGSTELWRPLRALSLLPPSRGLRNLLLLSDGHIQNTEFTLQLLRDNVQHSRLFTFGLSPTANRHMLRALAQAGGGSYDFFDTKTKHNWAEKVTCQVKRMASPGCSSVSVKWQQFNPTAPTPVQAPKQLHALFNDCHTLVYGFVPHCTQATLLGNLSGQELKTMVSTSDLQKTRGTFLHKLTARALIRDYEDGSLDADEAEHEGKKAELKSFIVELSKEFSILSQFTSFVAIEERDSEQAEEGFTDVPKLIAEEDVDFLPYISWSSPEHSDTCGPEEVEWDDSSSPPRDSALSRESPLTHEDDEDESEDSFDMFGPTSPPVRRALLCTSLHEQSFAAPPPPPPPQPSIYIEASAYEGSSRKSSRKSARLPCPPPQPSICIEASAYEGSSLGFSRKSARRARLSCPPPPPPQPSICIEDSSAYEGSSLGFSRKSARRARLSCPPPPPPQPSICIEASAYEGSSLSSSRKSARLPCPPPPPPQPSICIEASAYVSSSLSSSRQSARLSCPPPPPPQPSICIEASSAYEGSSLGFSRKSARRARLSCPPPPPPQPSICIEASAYEGSSLSSSRKSARLPCPPPPPPQPSICIEASAYEGSSLSSSRQSAPLPCPPPPAPKCYRFQKPLKLNRKVVPQKEQVDNLYEPLSGRPMGSGIMNLIGDVSYDVMSLEAESVRDVSPRATGLPTPDALPRPKFSMMEKASPVIFGSSSMKDRLSFAAPNMLSGYFARSETSDQVPETSDRGLFQIQKGMRTCARYSSLSKVDIRPGGVAFECGLAQTQPAPRRWRGRVVGHDLAPGVLDTAQASSFFGTNSANPETLKLKWTKIFQMQHAEGYWVLTTELGECINVDVDHFVDVFLKNKGIHSLGVRACADILKLIATLLVLQLMRVEKLEEGKLLRTLFCLNGSSQPRPEQWEQVKRAVDWVCWADRQYPCIYSRLEFGVSWESSTRQLLGYEGLPPFSPLSGLNLQRTTAPLFVH